MPLRLAYWDIDDAFLVSGPIDPEGAPQEDSVAAYLWVLDSRRHNGPTQS
jgi:hypothetical protein